MLALTGVIVNDSLVMITRYNQARDEGQPVNLALEQHRCRALQSDLPDHCHDGNRLVLPLLTETSEQAQYLIPAAISLAFWGTVRHSPHAATGACADRHHRGCSRRFQATPSAAL